VRTGDLLLPIGLACLAAAASFVALPPPEAALLAVSGALVLWVVVTDLRAFFIPDTASLGILVLGIAMTVLRAEPDDVTAALLDAALRGAVAGGVLLAVRLLYFRYSGVPGIGLGDVKLAAAAGPWLGWGMLPVALELAAIAALLVVGGAAWRRGERPERRMALPFGAFLAPAFWLCAYAEIALGWSGIG
jgi:leader peptidase (prepilin peptidase) / N-methyltransferase